MSKQSKRNRAEMPDDDNPKLTARDFARMRPAYEMVPEIVAAARRGRGRPKQTNTKQLVSLRLSRHVLEHFRASGEGWQTRIDEALGKHVRHAPAVKPPRRAARR